jgi:hypothetical protein
MAMGRLREYRELLTTLGRAAGLSSLALATMASGPCIGCPEQDECGTIEELKTARDEGVASASAAGSGPGAGSRTATNVATANQWDGTSCPSPAQYGAITELKFPNQRTRESVEAIDSQDGKCCYHVADYCPGGRPFLVDGTARVAELEPNQHDSRVASDSGTPWLADALLEHASIAAFARLSLQLLALGAPTELVRDAQLASLDELRHADFFFELASRLRGSPLRPAALDVRGALDDLSLPGLIESNLLEGCIGETLAAEQLRRRAEQVDDARTRSALLAIADDETRHAELAFRILAWCRDVASECTRRVLQRVLAERAPLRGEEVWRQVLSPLLGALAEGARPINADSASTAVALSS